MPAGFRASAHFHFQFAGKQEALMRRLRFALTSKNQTACAGRSGRRPRPSGRGTDTPAAQKNGPR
ncbi:MAG: hypothetical protein Q8S10_00805, partial [Thiobacillus sp.]|nr:hypothetical protein [Thiobacillus sp.]